MTIYIPLYTYDLIAKGYQEQRVASGAIVETVERDVKLALQLGTNAAGRTDSVLIIKLHIMQLRIPL